jgi:hypothetical protein
MADNVEADPGSGGAVFRTDDDGTAHWPYAKLAFGPDNTQTIVADANGARVPVKVGDALPAGANNIGDVDVATLPGTVETDIADSLAELEAIVAALAAVTGGSELQVDIVAFPAGALAGGAVVELDYDTGAGTENLSVVGIALPASGGAVAGGTATNPIRTDTTGTTTQPVSNAGTFAVQVSAALPAGDNNVGNVDVVTLPGTVEADIAASAADLADLAAAIQTEDAAHQTGDTGFMALAVRTDTPAVLSGTTGDYTPLQTDADGNLRVNVAAGGAAGGTSATDDGAFTAGSGAGTPAMGFVSTDTVDAGDVGVLGMDASRRLLVSVEVDNVGLLQATDFTAVFGAGSLVLATQADDLANTTDALVAAGLTYVFDGTTWDRLRGDATNGALVNLGANNDVTLATLPDTAAGDLAASALDLDSIEAMLAESIHFDDGAGFTPGTSSVMVVGMLADETSTDAVDEGDVGAPRMTLDRRQIVVPQGHAAGGLSIFRSLDLDESEEDVKTSPGCLYGWWITNRATAPRYVKLYNATAANVVVGTTAPVMTLGIPGSADIHVAANMLGGVGIGFDTAITVAATTGILDNDTGAPGANEIVVNLFYA